MIATHVLALVHLHGWDYFKPLAPNRVMLVQSAVDPSGVVASGERLVAANGGDYVFYQTKKKGAPLEIVYPKEGVPLVVSPTRHHGLRAHPNAAGSSPTTASAAKSSRRWPTARGSTPATPR